MLFDFLKPFYYNLEKKVAAKSIPHVADIAGRMKLADFRVPESSSTSSIFDHSAWDAVLKRHVKVGAGEYGDVKKVNVVDYDGVTKDSDFAAYMDSLSKAQPDSLPGPEQLAFWMNAYNAACIHLLVKSDESRKEKLTSINQLTDDSGPVWEKEAAVIGGKGVSLNYIEHEMLRKKWAEPAVHGCIVCASASCPDLRPEAFVAAKLRAQMDDQMRGWLSNDTKGLALRDNKLTLSRIFLWFADDFNGTDGLCTFLPQFVDDEKVVQKIQKTKNAGQIRYFEYDWTMNRA